MTPRVELYLADCLDKLPEIETASVDAIIADLPYGITASKWDSVIPLEPLWKQYKRIIKPKGAVVLFGSQPFTSRLVMSNPEWFRYELIWRKTMATGFLDANRRPMRAHESLLIFSDGQTTNNPHFWYSTPYVIERATPSRAPHYGAHTRENTSRSPDGRRYPVSVIKISNPNHNSHHQTEKPVALLAYLVRTYTNEGETVLDNAMGSGSTGVACVQEGRNFIGIEIEREYFDIAQERIAEAQAKMEQPQQAAMELNKCST